ncbi:MAG: hypothetical protein MI723_04505 [Caulobacterales bacterium]|nr:hypothetical protein [Caulobacterales bacterium]
MRALNVFAVLATLFIAIGLYKAQTGAQADRERVAELQSLLADEDEAARVLRNEIAHLEAPARLQALAEERLGLTSADPLRIVALEEAALLLPAAEEDEEGASAGGADRR